MKMEGEGLPVSGVACTAPDKLRSRLQNCLIYGSRSFTAEAAFLRRSSSIAA